MENRYNALERGTVVPALLRRATEKPAPKIEEVVCQPPCHGPGSIQRNHTRSRVTYAPAASSVLANDMITWRWTRGSGCLVAKRGVPLFDSNREQYGGASFNSLPEEKTNIQGSCSIA